MKWLHVVSFLLVIVGALNWLAFGLTGTELGGLLLGGMDTPEAKGIYVLVGIGALYLIATHSASCKMCKMSGGK